MCETCHAWSQRRRMYRPRCGGELATPRFLKAGPCLASEIAVWSPTKNDFFGIVGRNRRRFNFYGWNWAFRIFREFAYRRCFHFSLRFLIRTSTANSDIPFCLPSLNYVLPPRLVDMCADDAICLCQLWHSCCKISLVLVRGQGLASWKFRTKDCPCAS